MIGFGRARNKRASRTPKVQAQSIRLPPPMIERGFAASASHRAIILASAATVLSMLPGEVLAQCASAPTGPLSQTSGACTESDVTRNGTAGQGAVTVSNGASYTGTRVTLTAPSGITTVTINNTASLLLIDSMVTAVGTTSGTSGLTQFSGTGALSGTTITSTTAASSVGVEVRSGTLTIGSSATGATQITATSTGTSSGAGVALRTAGSGAVINATDAVLQASGLSSNTNIGAYASAGTINLTGGSITVTGTGSDGLWSLAGATINANGVNIQAGLYGAITSGTISLGLDSRNPSAPVHTVINAGSVGIYATGGSVTGTNAEVTSGNSGVLVVQAGTVNLTGGSITAVTGVGNTDTAQGGTFTGSGVAITTTGTGVSTSGARSVTTLQDNGSTHTTITTSNGATGILVRSGGQVTGSGVVVDAAGIGVDAGGANTRVTLQDGSSGGNATITAGGTALRVTGGASATGTNAALTTTGTVGIAYGAYAQGARIDLTGGSVTAQGANGAGLYADSGATITASGTTISTTAAATNAVGARATAGGTITLTGTPLVGTTITTDGTGSHGLQADGGGRITGDFTSVYTNGAGAHGVVAVGTGSSVTLTDSGVNTALDNAHGAYAANGGTITLTRTDIQTYGAGASAVFADAGGSIILNNLNTFSMGANNVLGAVASGTGSRLTLNSTFVNVYSSDGAGLFAAGAGTIIVNGGAVVTGDYYGGTIVANSPGILARGAGSSIQVSNGATSATYGANSPGLRADTGARIDFAGYGVFTYQPNSPGAQADGSGSTVTLTGTINRTSGPSSAGLLITSAGTIIVTGTEVTTGFRVTGSTPPVLQFPDAEIGLEAHGADVLGAGSRLQAENAAITTNGNGAVGIRVSQGGTALVTGGIIRTNGADTAAGGADGVRATDAGSSVTLTGGALVTTTNINAVGLHALAGGTIAAMDATVTTQGQNAHGVQAGNAGAVQIAGGSVTTAGAAAHGIAAIDGGALAATDTTVAVAGTGSAAIYLAGNAPSTISVTGGSLSAASNAIVLAEGGTGTVSLSGGTAITPGVVNGRLLLALVTEDAVGNPANLTLNISGMPALTGDIVVDPSTLTYSLSNSSWTGNLVLTGPGNTATATLTTAQWTGDLLADAGNSATVALTQGSLWTGLARNATNIAIDAGSRWNVTGDSNATGTVTSAGLIQFLLRSDAYTTLTTGNYVGNSGRIGFNTYLGTDGSPSNLLIVNGGTASGNTSVLVSNTGGPGALTTGDGIRIVQVVNGGTTATGSFALGSRVAAGSYEYLLFRGGSTSASDWFLRTHADRPLVDPGNPLTPQPSTPGVPAGPAIPLYRPEVALYVPVPALARQMGLSTLGTLHERVGEEENLRGLPEPRAYADGVWARAIGERVRNRWNGTVDAGAVGNLIGLQAGFDILRRTSDSGHRDHAGVYVAYTDYNSPSVRGFALGIQNLAVGRLLMSGPSVGAYWTHFGPSGWYIDAVFQASWYDVKATSFYGAGISTNATGYTASLEAGYPIRFGAGNRWLIEPQAQIIYQGVSVDRSRDQYSSVDWDEGAAWTGRLGARLQYTGRDEQGTLWQPYARANLWHAFSGSDRATFGSNAPIVGNFGDTALEMGGGVTARVNASTSFYGQASYRWSLDGGRARQSSTQGTIGIRLNW